MALGRMMDRLMFQSAMSRVNVDNDLNMILGKVSSEPDVSLEFRSAHSDSGHSFK